MGDYSPLANPILKTTHSRLAQVHEMNDHLKQEEEQTQNWQEAILGWACMHCTSTCKEWINSDEQMYVKYTGGDIARVCNSSNVEIGRLPQVWAQVLRKKHIRSVLTVLEDSKRLNIMDSFLCSLKIIVHRDFFVPFDQISCRNSISTINREKHPTTCLLELLSLRPHKKAALDRYSIRERTEALLNLENTLKRHEQEQALAAGKAEKDRLPILDMSEEYVSEFQEMDNQETTYGQRELNKICNDATEGINLPVGEQPENMKSKLRHYQLQAIHWMRCIESNSNAEELCHPCWEEYRISPKVEGDGVKRRRVAGSIRFFHNGFTGEVTLDFPSGYLKASGGLLCDSMGLGKTVITIGHILNSMKKNTKGNANAGTLIVVPMTLLAQWKDEINVHAPSLSVETYYHDRNLDKLKSKDIVLTTYGIVISEHKATDSALHALVWKRIVLDEAHYVKNGKSRSAKACNDLKSAFRWCLTGTPIQNSLLDLQSLFQFLKIEPWGNPSWFTKLIQQPYEKGNRGALILLKSILQPMLLRRTTQTRDKNGQHILVLPTCVFNTVKLSLSPLERDFYNSMYLRAKKQFDEYVKDGKVLHNYANVLVMLLRLRQACNHPYLVLRGANESTSKWKHYMLGKDTQGGADDAKENFDMSTYAPPKNENVPFHANEPSAWNSADEKFNVDLGKCWVGSTKTDAIVHYIAQINEKEENKVVVFTQWTSFMDILEHAFRVRGISAGRLDGSQSQHKRKQVLDHFASSRQGCPYVLLCSLKAGGVGLNLVQANHVILCDPWWNPAVEMQAIGRIHRIGQKKNVYCTRFIIQDSVEIKMLQVQERKKHICDGALGDQGNQGKMQRLEDLKLLFESTFQVPPPS